MQEFRNCGLLWFYSPLSFLAFLGNASLKQCGIIWKEPTFTACQCLIVTHSCNYSFRNNCLCSAPQGRLHIVWPGLCRACHQGQDQKTEQLNKQLMVSNVDSTQDHAAVYRARRSFPEFLSRRNHLGLTQGAFLTTLHQRPVLLFLGLTHLVGEGS